MGESVRITVKPSGRLHNRSVDLGGLPLGEAVDSGGHHGAWFESAGSNLWWGQIDENHCEG